MSIQMEMKIYSLYLTISHYNLVMVLTFGESQSVMGQSGGPENGICSPVV